MPDHPPDRDPSNPDYRNLTEADRKTYRKAAQVNLLAGAIVVVVAVIALAIDGAFSDDGPGLAALNHISTSALP